MARAQVVTRQMYGLLVGMAVCMGITAIVVSQITGESLRDPDGFLGPAYFRMPAMVLAAFAIDVIPRALWRARRNIRDFGAEFVAIVRSYWTPERIAVVTIGLTSFYVTYVSYRNLKNALLVYYQHTRDSMLHAFDHWLLFGHDPAILLHQALGESISAQVLAAVYLFFLPLTPLTVAVWLVWAKIGDAIWYTTANCLCWTLGTISYYAIPTLGPNFQYPWLYKDLDNTGVKSLQDSLWNGRVSIHFNPFADGVQSVAGFASLHCALILCITLTAQYTVPPTRLGKLVTRSMWVFFVLTVFSTIYFGWHYLADDIAGCAIALASVYVAGRATGHRFDRRGRLLRERPEAVGVPELTVPA